MVELVAAAKDEARSVGQTRGLAASLISEYGIRQLKVLIKVNLIYGQIDERNWRLDTTFFDILWNVTPCFHFLSAPPPLSSQSLFFASSFGSDRSDEKRKPFFFPPPIYSFLRDQRREKKKRLFSNIRNHPSPSINREERKIRRDIPRILRRKGNNLFNPFHPTNCVSGKT